MDNRELLSFQTLVNSLDTDYGKRTPKNLATMRVELGKAVSVQFKNPEASVKKRLLLDRLCRDYRKVRIFLEPGDIVLISHTVEPFEKKEYYRAEKGPRGIRLTSMVMLDSELSKKNFARIDDGRLSWASCTFNYSVSALIGVKRPNILNRLPTLAGVNLIFEKALSQTVNHRCTWYAPANYLFPELSNVNNSTMIQWANPEIGELKYDNLPEGKYFVGIDSDTFAIRVICHPSMQSLVLGILTKASIHYHKVDTVYKLLLDQSNDLVRIGFEEK